MLGLRLGLGLEPSGLGLGIGPIGLRLGLVLRLSGLDCITGYKPEVMFSCLHVDLVMLLPLISSCSSVKSPV